MIDLLGWLRALAHWLRPAKVDVSRETSVAVSRGRINGDEWTLDELRTLKAGIERDDTHEEIAAELGTRTAQACRLKAHRLGWNKYVRRVG
jgi:hypothetical protein